ncbi:MAG TPA: hypothetical protein VII92_20370 [Anaerolineae bacterium]
MDDKKLIKFIEAALSNPAHPIYKAGMVHSPALQHYAVNVSILGALTGEQWVKENFQGHAEKINTVMELIEAESAAPVAPAAPATPVMQPDPVAAMRAELDALKAEIKAMATPPAPDTDKPKDDDEEDDDEGDK